VIQATIVNIISTIWYSRNQSRFHNKKTHWQLAVNNIISAVTLSGNYTTKPSNSSVKDLIMLKKFNVNVHPTKPLSIKEVIWTPPLVGWIKCNTDGSSNTTASSCGGIFRDSNSNFISCFAENIGGGSAYHAELSAIMRAVEIANQRRWSNLWIESDSSLVVMAFKNSSMIPCCLRNRWINCRNMLYRMNFLVTHVYREGNRCADKLASKGLEVQGVTVWLQIPEFLNCLFTHDRLGMPNFRVSNV
jgi:ribonuclease HI